MKKKIIGDINVLRQVSEPVTRLEAKEIIQDLNDSLEGQKGYGLCAIQIGISKQVAIVRLPNCKLDLINPKIVEKHKVFRMVQEGCLSIPGIYVDTMRYKEIVVENGDGKKYSLEGLEAIVVQHEISHMQGKLIIDKGIKWHKRK